MSENTRKKRAKEKRQRVVKAHRVSTLHKRKTIETKFPTYYPRTRGIAFSDDGSIVRITKGVATNGKIIGHITKHGRTFNIVIVPPPKPDAPDYDDIEKKQKKKGEGEA